MPVPKNAWCILGYAAEGDGKSKSKQESPSLPTSVGFRIFAGVERSNSVCRSNSRREDQLLLKDVEFPERNGKEHPVVGAAGSESDELGKVILW